MTWKTQDDELLITPTTIGSQKSLAVWPVGGSGASLLAQHKDSTIRFFLTQQETDALAKHLDPEAAKAKEAWEAFGEWLSEFKTDANINREQIFGMISQLGVKL